jgi:hypothetical protein
MSVESMNEQRIEIMATLTTNGLASMNATQGTPLVAKRHVRRRITPQAGHAIETLGHAIEYLTDEYVHNGGGLSTEDGRLDAIQLLMALNRQVYYECPERPTLGARCRALLHLRTA